jgi:hypothetical protein
MNIPDKIKFRFNPFSECWFLRREKMGELIEIWFCHSDDHYNQAMTITTENFISGYRMI